MMVAKFPAPQHRLVFFYIDQACLGFNFETMHLTAIEGGKGVGEGVTYPGNHYFVLHHYSFNFKERYINGSTEYVTF